MDRHRNRYGWVVVAALALIGVSEPPTIAQDTRLRYLATARQLGPVAYRDPLGVPSPDGRWLATHVGLHLRLRPLAGGPARELGDGRTRRLQLVWRRDSTSLVAREADRERTWFDWRQYDPVTGGRAPLWPDRESLLAPDGSTAQRGDLLELSFAPDGRAAGLVAQDSGRQVWIFDADGRVLEIVGQPGKLSNIAWTPTGQVACADSATDRPLLTLECGRSRGRSDLGEVRGPIAFAFDGGVFVGRPNAAGTVDLWRLDPATGSGARLTSFGRDTYAPYVLDDGRVLFKLQQYAVTIARVGATGGMTIPVTSFQSETPSWDWSGEHIAFTFGSWRRLVDDARYPDIAQQIGVVRASDGIAAAPQRIIRHSASEDQGMHWSPNGRWIVLHSHADGTDDIWLQPADGSAPAVPITHGGNETGWPRFSPDGHWIVYPTDHRGLDGDRLGLLQLVGFDPERGRVTAPQHPIEMPGFDGQVTFAEFGPDSRMIYFEAMHGVGERAIWRIDRGGGPPQLVHRFASEQWFTGISVAPDGAWIAYIAPADDGHLQLFKVPAGGGEPLQLTTDPSDKTHPAWSPRGDQIAFSVFNYTAHFWLLER